MNLFALICIWNEKKGPTLAKNLTELSESIQKVPLRSKCHPHIFAHFVQIVIQFIRNIFTDFPIQ